MSSTIDTTKPPLNGQLLSADLRDNFTAAANDINALIGSKLPLTGGTLTGALTLPTLNVTGSITVNGSPLLFNNQTITVSGDATGSGASSIALTLASSGVTANTYANLTVDAKGRVTSARALVQGDISGILGTSAVVNTGTSGATIPLLNGTNTWATKQTFAGAVARSFPGDAFTNTGATTTLDFATGNNFALTANANFTLPNPVNTTHGQEFTVYIQQDATGSRRLTGVGTNWSFPGGTLPTLTTAPSAIDSFRGVVLPSGQLAVQSGLNYQNPVANANLVLFCSKFDQPNYWATFNTPAPTIAGTLVTDPLGGLTAQQITFPTNRTGYEQVLSPRPAAGTYTASVYLRVATVVTGQQLRLAYHKGDFPIAATSSAFVPTTTWAQYGPLTFTIGAGDVAPGIVVENIGGDNTLTIPSNETIEVWGLQVVPGSSMTAYQGCATLPVPIANATSANATTAISKQFAPNVTGVYDTVSIVTGASHGTATVSGTNLVYQSAAGYSGSDSFQYNVTNTSGVSNTATATMTITASTAKITGSWLFLYSGPSLTQLQANAPHYNLVNVGFAIGHGDGSGNLSFDTAASITPTEVANWKNSGRTALLMIGGSSANAGTPAAITLLSSTNVTQFVNSAITIIDTYGFQGVTYDLESDSGQFTAAFLQSATSQLKSHYGSGFLIACDPAPYQLRAGGIYRSCWDLFGSQIDWFNVQWYSQCGQSDSFFINSYILPDIDNFIAYGIPASKIVMGCSDNSGDCGAPGGPNTYLTAYNSRNTIRGAVWWASNTDQAQGYSFQSTFGPVLGT